MSFKELQKRKALTSNVLKLQVDKFISNRNNQIIMPSTPINAALNTNGFIEVLNGAKKSTGTELLESIIPKDADLSIKQNEGFSFFLWFYLFKKSKKEKEKEKNEKDAEKNKLEEKNVYYIFRKGSSVDEFTPTLGITDNYQHLIIELSTSSIKKTFLLANKTIERDHLYSLGVSFNINYEENYTEVSIFIDGKLDTQSKINGEPIHNQGNVFFGKIDYSSKGFKGVVADLMLIPSILNDNDIIYAHNEGLKNLSDSNGEKIDMNIIFNEIFKKKRLINKYAFYTNKTKYEIENLCLSNSKMLEVVKNYDEEERVNDNRKPPPERNLKHEKMIEEMTKFLKNEDNRILCNKLEMNSQLIYTCFYLANHGEDNLEIERVLIIFETLKEILLFDVEEDFIINLAKILYAFFKSEEVKYLRTKRFFINLQKSLDEYEQKEREEEAENAKYAKKAKKKIINNNEEFKKMSFNYLLRRQKDSRNDPLPPIRTRGFGNCVTEHENLLLKTQNLRDCIEAEQEQNLKNFHSMFRIKDLYDVPKNLPGDDSTFPNVKIVHSNNTSTSSYISTKTRNKNNNGNNNQSKISLLTQDDKQQSQTMPNDINNNSTNTINSLLRGTEGNKKKLKKISINDEEIKNNSIIHNMLLDILNEEDDKVKTPELGSNSGPEKAEVVEKDIFKQREEIQKRKEELERKRLEEEKLKNKKVEVYVEPPKKVHYSFDPKVPEDWSNGNFELVINHCYDCHKHANSTRHYEYQFVNKFNQIGDAVKTTFPNSIIIGNLDDHEYYGNFDIYLRNTGLPSNIKNKYYIYRKNIKKKFPSVNEILDKLVCLVIMYGSSLNVEKAQVDPFIPDSLGPLRKNITHEFPAEMSEKAEEIRKKITTKKPETKIDEERTKFYCTNNGCNKIFVQKNNHKHSCHYHKGVYQFGSIYGLWPECWTCCEGKWDSKGCTTGPHNGILLEKRVMLCLNHGDVNKKGYPDSVCGTWYTSRSTDGCKYHSGCIERGKFTCCGGDPNSQGCVEGEHKTATYPEEKARLYFYPKAINNPGIQNDTKKKPAKIPVSELIKKCFYFKETEEYPDYKKLKDENDKRIDRESDMVRQCLRIGCNKRYKDKTNTEKSCMCHSGRWDFGGSKFNLGYIEEDEIKREMELEELREKKQPHENDINERKKKKSKELRLMNVEPCYGKWRPHWTCCGGKWDAKPCTPCRHQGPLLENLKYYYLPYRYPDIRFQLTFKRIVSDRWASYIEQFMFDEKKVRRICKNFLQKKSSLNLNNIHELLNNLKLKYVIEQEDPSFFLKYRDLCLKQETFKCLCDEGESQIDMERFIKWWFSDYLTLYNELHPPPKKEKKEKKNEEEEEKNSQ